MQNDVYYCDSNWNRNRPRVLVVCCSDGRLQENVDEFLRVHLSIAHYDRLYLPGGPGALASSGYDMLRSIQNLKEFEFLITSHQIEDVVLLFHGPSEDGPADACCADYRRKLPRATPGEIRRQQEKDVVEFMQTGIARKLAEHIYCYRCEVRSDNLIQFVPIPL